MTNTGLRFGLIGAGGIGRLRAAALAGADGHRLAAVADADRARAQSLARGAHASIYDDYQTLLRDAEIDAVMISTPPQFHEAIAVAALEAGKHVLCEKPLASTPESARRMVEAARHTGRTLATGFNHRYFEAIQFVKSAIDSGSIGELDHIRAFAGHTGLSEFSAPWMHDPDVIGGGALCDNGVHMLDLVRYLLGEVDEVYGVATSNVWKLGGAEDNGIAILRSPAGKHAVLQATWTEWKGYRFHIEAYGDRGMARAYYAPMMSSAIYLDRPGGKARKTFNVYPANIVREKLHGWQSTVIRGFRQEFRDFAALCRGQRGGIIADGFAGFRAAEIARAVHQCSRERAAIRLAEPF